MNSLEYARKALQLIAHDDDLRPAEIRATALVALDETANAGQYDTDAKIGRRIRRAIEVNTGAPGDVLVMHVTMDEDRMIHASIVGDAPSGADKGPGVADATPGMSGVQVPVHMTPDPRNADHYTELLERVKRLERRLGVE